MGAAERFRLGVNYWPSRAAMDWLPAFDPGVLRTDFERIAQAGMDTVRVFLRWDDLQPIPSSVDSAMLANVIAAADTASAANLELVVTLFTGHMSGVNWIPAWATGGTDGDERFRVVSGGRALAGRRVLRNWYGDAEVVDAQALVAHRVATALAGHPAVWAWDLGNENSNCTVPPDGAAAQAWIGRMSSVLRACDPRVLVTIGTHMEDLEEDRKLGPEHVASWCDFVCMHGYPSYASWSKGATDPDFVPFLAEMTTWLASGKPVLFAEFGQPTLTAGVDGPAGREMLVAEDEAATYAGRVLDSLRALGSIGALAWCYSDYDSRQFTRAPFDVAVHERSFGLWRADGTPKPAVDVFASRAALPCQPPVEHLDPTWVDVSRDEFNADRRAQLRRLYDRYLASR